MKVLNEKSPLSDFESSLPGFTQFLSDRFQVPPEACKKNKRLQDLVVQFGLPPAPILYAEAQLDRAHTQVNYLTAEQVAKREDLFILDVRENWELQFGKIPKSILIPELEVEEKWGQLPKDQPILCYCHRGMRSLNVALRLKHKGLNLVYVLEGGIEAWGREIDPQIQSYDSGCC